MTPTLTSPVSRKDVDAPAAARANPGSTPIREAGARFRIVADAGCPAGCMCRGRS